MRKVSVVPSVGNSMCPWRPEIGVWLPKAKKFPGIPGSRARKDPPSENIAGVQSLTSDFQS
jgi:hypothetical protein